MAKQTSKKETVKNKKISPVEQHKQFLKKLETAASDDCWIIIYKDGGMGGKRLLLSGPASYKNLKSLPGADEDWGDSIGSIETGPHARLTVYDDEDFSGDHIDTYGPNTRTTVSGDLDDNIDSIVISQA